MEFRLVSYIHDISVGLRVMQRLVSRGQASVSGICVAEGIVTAPAPKGCFFKAAVASSLGCRSVR